MTQYTYTQASGVDVARLVTEVQASPDITIALDYINATDALIDIYMKADLSADEQTTLSGIVMSHVATPLTPPKLLLDVDGAQMSHPKMAAIGRHYQLHGMIFSTATEGSFKQLDENHDNLNYGIMEFRDHDGTVVSGIENMHKACCTIINWEPPFDYEIMGGMFHQYGAPSGELMLNVTALPDIPAAAGGNIRFVISSDLRFIGPDTGLHVLGHTTSELKYDPVYHTNKLRMALHHGSGVQHEMYIAFEIFVGG